MVYDREFYTRDGREWGAPRPDDLRCLQERADPDGRTYFRTRGYHIEPPSVGQDGMHIIWDDWSEWQEDHDNDHGIEVPF